MTNPNYDTYLGAALQLQRWRDFIAHVSAYVVINAVLVLVWLMSGQGAFWLAVSLIGWGFGLSSQHWLNALWGPITDDRVQASVRDLRKPEDSEMLSVQRQAESSGMSWTPIWVSSVHTSSHRGDAALSPTTPRTR